MPGPAESAPGARRRQAPHKRAPCQPCLLPRDTELDEILAPPVGFRAQLSLTVEDTPRPTPIRAVDALPSLLTALRPERLGPDPPASIERSFPQFAPVLVEEDLRPVQ